MPVGAVQHAAYFDRGRIAVDSLGLKYLRIMWHPPECIRHPLQPARWPTAGEAARSRWFSPLTAGRLELRERTWVPAMVPWRATDDGVVTGEVLEWYERFAVGRKSA